MRSTALGRGGENLHDGPDSDDGDDDQQLNERKRFPGLVLSTEKHSCFISRAAEGLGLAESPLWQIPRLDGHLNVTQTGRYSNLICRMREFAPDPSKRMRWPEEGVCSRNRSGNGPQKSCIK